MNVQHKLSIMRPPRVQITYDVETLGSFETKEIPFVLGIIADLAGATQLEPFYKRRFILIDGVILTMYCQALLLRSVSLWTERR